jgi:hypothetical protein
VEVERGRETRESSLGRPLLDRCWRKYIVVERERVSVLISVSLHEVRERKEALALTGVGWQAVVQHMIQVLKN